MNSIYIQDLSPPFALLFPREYRDIEHYLAWNLNEEHLHYIKIHDSIRQEFSLLGIKVERK